MSSTIDDNGKLLHWSPSQVVLFRNCRRRWVFQKKFAPDLREPETPQQAVGHAIHSELEEYVRSGTAPTHPVALLALDALPPPDGRLWEPEVALVDVLSAAGIPCKGYVDLWDFSDAPERVVVWDYKTRGSFKYTLKPDALAVDPQMITYAAGALATDPQAKAVELHHLYLRTSAKPDLRDVSVTVSRAQVEDVFAGIEHDVVSMAETAKAATPADVRRNDKFCMAYGRVCPYLDMCPGASIGYTPPQPSFDTESTMDLAEQIAANKAAQSSTLTPPVRASGVNPPDAAVSSTGVVGLYLYVDCVPVKGVDTVIRLEDEIARRSVNVAAKLGVEDIRDRKLFGEGKAQLVADFRRDPPVGTVLATTGDLAGPVIEALSPLATVVVRGVR